MGDLSEHDLYEPSQVQNLDSRLLILTSGCQGDFISALRRLAYGEDSVFRLKGDDLVIFSSKIIPGNEKKIYRIMNKITEAGARIATAFDYQIHASGHPAQEDLRLLLDASTPDFYFPIHGESFFLRRHSEWFSKNYPNSNSRVILNGDIVSFFPDEAPKTDRFGSCEPILIHGNGQMIERSQISQRRKMACNGIVLVSISKASKCLSISTAGLPLHNDHLVQKLEKNLLKKLSSELFGQNDDYLQDQVRIFVRQFYQAHLGYKPYTIVHLLN
jgi:ribonuclease J